MLKYTIENYTVLLTAVVEHLELVGLALLFSIPLAAIFYFLSSINQACRTAIYFVLLFLYCIPSIALFCFLIPFFGLGKITALIGLVIYNQILLLRNFVAAHNAIPRAILEVSDAMAIPRFQKFRIIEFPIMLPHLISGLRIATVSTTGISTVAALINAGGLGNILFEGMRMIFFPKIIWGILLISGLAIVLNTIFAKLENKAVLLAHGKQEIAG